MHIPSHLSEEQQRRARSLVFQIVGLFDVVLGVAIAVFGPGFIDADATIALVLYVAGGVFALMGLGIFWWGRRRYGTSAEEERSGPVVRRMR